MNIPHPTKHILETIDHTFSDFFGEDLVGIYVHGSLAMGCYNPQSSDIDFLIVVKQSLTLLQKQQLIATTLQLDKNTSSKLEFSIITLDQLKNVTYPTPFEFHYSDEWKQNYIDHKVDLEKIQLDPDLAAHFVITKKRGFIVTGIPINEIFPDIPHKYYLDSITKDMEWSFEHVQKGPDTGTCKVPPYAVLNACRVLAFVKNDLITSKLEGGEWGLKNLPEIYTPIIQEALNEYKKCNSSKKISCKLLKEFSSYCMKIISKKHE